MDNVLTFCSIKSYLAGYTNAFILLMYHVETMILPCVFITNTTTLVDATIAYKDSFKIRKTLRLYAIQTSTHILFRLINGNNNRYDGGFAHGANRD